jgi:hypothetical protein
MRSNTYKSKTIIREKYPLDTKYIEITAGRHTIESTVWLGQMTV